MEDVRRLGGKTVSVSFYAKASTAGMKLGASVGQAFGAGGSAVTPAVGQSVTLSAGWARYSLTFGVPSTVGKTVGTDGSDRTTLTFWLSSGATQSGQAGNIGVQSGTVNIWGIQLEIGTVATPLEKPDPADDLARCLRFFQVGQASTFALYGTAGMGMNVSSGLPATMRINLNGRPITNDFNGNVSGFTIGGLKTSALILSGTVVATAGVVTYNVVYTASADL